MNIELNLDLRMQVEDGQLIVRLVQRGTYPHFEEETVAEASVSLDQLQESQP